MKTSKLLFLLILGLIVTGCSKDSPDQNMQKDEQVQLGVFLDSAVEGLYFETPSRSGFTNSQGEFQYLEGETIAFYLGEIELGSTTASKILTPISIVSTPKATINTPEVKYMAALLQTLDIDGDASNGIKLEPAVTAVLDNKLVRSRENARANILEVVKRVKEKTGIELNEVFPEEAASHLAQTLGQNYELQSSLIPAIKSLNLRLEPMSVFNWELEFNEENWIRRINQIEKNPEHLFSEYDFLSFNINGQPTAYTYREYANGSIKFSEGIKILYHEDGTVAGFEKIKINEDQSWGKHYQIVEISEVDGNGYVTKANYFDTTGNFIYRYEFQRNENGEKAIMTRFSTEEGSGDTMEIKYSISYNNIGDLEKVIQEYQNGSTRTHNYLYRENNVLQQEVVTNSGNNTVYDYFYDENEIKLQEFHISQGDWRSEYVEFYPNGNYKLVNTYYQEWHQEIATFDEEGFAELKLWHLDRSGSYQIDYRDPDWNLLKIDYYNDAGIYLKTEYYEGNLVVRTEYA